MVTLATLGILLLLLVLIVTIDMFLFNTSLQTAFYFLVTVHLGLGRHYIFAAAIIGILAAIAIDLRRRKLQN